MDMVQFKIAKFLENKNVDYFAVARLEEAIELRQNDIKTTNIMFRICS